MFLSVFGIVLFVAVGGFLFIKLSPEFGADPTAKEKVSFEKTGHYKEEKFFNLIPTNMDMNTGGMFSLMIDFIKGVPNREPKSELPIHKIDSLSIVQNVTKPTLMWFGHSAFLLQLDGKNILLDPMLGPVPAPHPWLGGKRYNHELPITIEKIPKIDAVVISHDHYDHLDYGSIQELKAKTEHFYVPLGVGAHLRYWGVEAEKIHEFDWWEEGALDSLKIVFTPSRHFLGRGLGNRFSTLWGSWVIQGKNENIYFSGDGGYGPHFKEIGAKYGPFDFAMMECGQYNKKWKDIHMMPEETAQAAVDVQAKTMIPIHWGAFSLALHTWFDPIERVTKKAKALNQPIIVPEIGEVIDLDQEDFTSSTWWESVL